jgi:fructose-1,6-bisphosphatase/inositol monophosphatase family enzyme
MLVPFKFSAIRGKGAFFNGSQIKASSQDELVKAFLVTEVGNLFHAAYTLQVYLT